MNRFFQHLLLVAASIGLAIQGCSFFAGPQEAESFGELQINIRFATAKESLLSSPQAIDRVTIVILKHSELQEPGQLEREVVRKEILVGENRIVRAVLQVPLQKDEINCFIVRVLAFEQRTLLYSGEDIPCFSEGRKNLTATILMQPVTFRINFPFENITFSQNRMTNFSVQIQDSTLTDLEVTADSIRQRLPVQTVGFFNHPIMLFGDTTVIRVRALRNQEFRGEVLRRVIYAGVPADVLAALVWDQPVDLDLEIVNPLRATISAATSLGDSVNGNGVLRATDKDGFGPEVYEWRANGRPVNGLFQILVRRPPNNLAPASGRLYVFLREKQILQRRQIINFAFTPQDTGPTKAILQLTWPPN